jgi:hypothetical protein
MFKVQTRYRDQFWEWCQKNNILCEYMGTTPREETDTWYIGNTKDRTLAILRWG